MTISAAVRKRVRDAANGRCGYCLMAAQLIHAPMEIEHIIPIVAGGTDDEENLWLACPWCNLFKGAQTHAVDPETGVQVRLFNPREQIGKEQFTWDENRARILGLTPCGRATVVALKLNHEEALAFRKLMASINWYPPTI
jgi:hypothetical protein